MSPVDDDLGDDPGAPEVLNPDKPPPDAIALRRPDVPVTMNDLAALRKYGHEVIDARIEILETARRAAIRRTWPSDWNLYKARDAHITAFLHDAGCERVRDVVGIEIRNVSDPIYVPGESSDDYAIQFTGDGYCKFTTQTVEAVIGVRYSNEDFVKDVKGIARRMAVTKAARANLNGNIVRQLAALKQVAPEELTEAWKGTNKRVDDCIKARGFGTTEERLGATREGVPDVEPPVCPHCGTKGVYRPAKGDRKAFYGCPNYESHRDKKFIVDAAEWVQKQQAAKAPPSAPAPEPARPAATEAKSGAKSAAPAGPATQRRSAAQQQPLTAAEIPFGSSREPGEEG
jgi:hypothetical protein